jgi:PAS domain S-box-containing protein
MTTDPMPGHPPGHDAALGHQAPIARPDDFGIGRLFWHIHEAVIVADTTDGRILLWNPAAEAMFGYTAEEAAGLTVEALVPDYLRDHHLAGITRYRATGHGALINRSTAIELPARCKDGTELLIELSLTAVAEGPDPRRHVMAIVRDVSERQLAAREHLARLREHAARLETEESLALLDTLLSSAPVGMGLVDRQLRYRRVNDRLAAINGVPAAAHLGRTIREVLPQLAETLEPIHQRVLDTGQAIVDVEVHGETAAAPGEPRTWLASYYPVRSVDGAVIGVGLVVVETTEQRRTAAALQASEERFRALIEHSSDAVAVVDATGVIRYVAPSVTHVMGYTVDELVGQNGFELVHPEDRERTAAVLTDVLRAPGRTVTAEYRMRHRDGSWRWVEGTGTNLLHLPGIAGIVVNFRDISERWLAAAALAESETRYRQLVELSPDLIGIHQDGRVVFVNVAGARLLGADRPEQIIGRPVLELVHPDFRSFAMKRMQRMAADGQPLPFAAERILRLDGTVLDVEVAGIPFVFNGRPAAQLIVRDISARLRLEAERAALHAAEQTARAEAEAAAEADRLKSDLINTVSHELRTPLGAIKGFATTLLTYYDRIDREEQHAFLREIDNAADRLQELVDNLLRIGQLESGTLTMHHAPLDPGQVLHSAVEAARQRHPERTITLEVQDQLPALVGDARRLEQVAANLIDNAIKYSPAGGAVRVTGGAGTDGGVQFSVQDQGIGIPRAAQERIFERFYRVDSGPAREIGGTGLGLAICKSIVEAHGGSITLQSSEGKGSTFTVTIPPAGSGRRALAP